MDSGPKSVDIRVSFFGNFGKGFIPRDGAEAGFVRGGLCRRCAAGDGAGGRGVLAFEITRDFAAEEAAGDRVRRIAAQLRAASGCIDVDKERTGVGQSSAQTEWLVLVICCLIVSAPAGWFRRSGGFYSHGLGIWRRARRSD